MMSPLRFAALVLLVSGNVGCQPDLATVEVVADTTPPLESSIGPDSITMTSGTAAAITFIATDADGDAVEVSAFPSGGVSLRQRETLEGLVPNAYVLLADREESGFLLIQSSDASGELEVPYSITP